MTGPPGPRSVWGSRASAGGCAQLFRPTGRLGDFMDRVEEPGQSRVDGPRSGVSDLGLLDALHLPVVAADLDQRIVYWNRAAEDFYGLTQEQLSATSMLDLHVGADAQERAHEIMTTVSSGQRWVGELSVR